MLKRREEEGKEEEERARGMEREETWTTMGVDFAFRLAKLVGCAAS